MASVGSDLDRVDLDKALVIEREQWGDGPPHELFKRLRRECPVHWSRSIPEYPEEAGYWSVTTADDIHAVSRDWRTYSSERGGVTAANVGFPLELVQAMFIGMDPPKHDRLKALFQAGFTPKRIADHEGAIRQIVIDVLERLDGREKCELVNEIAQPVVSRVIGSFMGIPPEDDAVWANLMNSTLGAGDPDLNPLGPESLVHKDIPEIFERCRRLIAERRESPTDDLTSVLVHAEVDGQKLEEHEIVMGFFLLVAAGNDSTKATYASGMRALMQHPDQRRLLFEDPSLIHVPRLRALPPHRDLRRRARRPADPRGGQGRDVVRLLQPGRDALRGPRPLRRSAQPRASGLRSRRPPLLPGDGPGPARAADPVRGDAGPLPGHGDRRHADGGRVAVHQPAQDAAGPARPGLAQPALSWTLSRPRRRPPPPRALAGTARPRCR